MTKIMSTNSKKRAREDDLDDTVATKAVFVSNRDADFNESTWWMVDIENYNGNQGASALVKRCMRNHEWNLDWAKKIIQAYRQLLTLKKGFEDWDAEILSPSHLVDKMWHQHILDIGNYCHDMMLLCGRVVLHNPDGALDIQAKKTRDTSTFSELIKKFGKSNVNVEVWGFPEATNTISDRSRAVNQVPADDGSLTICFRDQGPEKIFTKMKRTTRLGTAFQSFAKRKGLNKTEDLRFILYGDRVYDLDTPESLGMNDMDQIDAVRNAHGC
mmetsp:Transcript_6478/g.15293  ORF Transcript_6478/g.15293 Transcript_6478/m.15293 type:complete len:271 (-) Transcript_6478:306-1118(-)